MLPTSPVSVNWGFQQVSAEFGDWDKAMSGQKSVCIIHWGQAQGVEWRLSRVFCYRARDEIGETVFEGDEEGVVI